MTAPARTLLIAAVALALAGCAGAQKPSVAPAPSSPRSEPAAAPDIQVETIRSAPFGLEAAREAHRQNEQRRRLRYLEALEPGYLLRTTREALPEDRILAGAVSVRELREIGRLLFQHDYTFADGLGSGESRRRAGGRRKPLPARPWRAVRRARNDLRAHPATGAGGWREVERSRTRASSSATGATSKGPTRATRPRYRASASSRLWQWR
jgi:hypothetical protein